MSTKGTNTITYTVTTKASSVFAAAAKAMKLWQGEPWYDPDAVLTVESGERSWNVRARRVREWQEELACAKEAESEEI